MSSTTLSLQAFFGYRSSTWQALQQYSLCAIFIGCFPLTTIGNDKESLARPSIFAILHKLHLYETFMSNLLQYRSSDSSTTL